MLFKQRLRWQELCGEGHLLPFKVDKIALCRRVGVVVFDGLRDDKMIVFVKGNQVAVKGGIIGGREAKTVLGIEVARFVHFPCTRGVAREDRAKHVERTDVGRGLAASVRVRGEDEVCKRLPQHGGKKYIKSAG